MISLLTYFPHCPAEQCWVIASDRLLGTVGNETVGGKDGLVLQHGMGMQYWRFSYKCALKFKCCIFETAARILLVIVETIATLSKWRVLASWSLFTLFSLNFAYPFKVQPLSFSPALLSQSSRVLSPFLLLSIYVLYDLFLKHIL